MKVQILKPADFYCYFLSMRNGTVQESALSTVWIWDRSKLYWFSVLFEKVSQSPQGSFLIA